MSHPFVWFECGSERPAEAAKFYEELLSWKGGEGPGGASLLAGVDGPFAHLNGKSVATSGWVPYVEVKDVDASTVRASKLGAKVLQPRTKGPMGDFTIVRDPGGAPVALWQKA